MRWSTGEAPCAQLRIRACDGQLHFCYGIDIENGQRSEVTVCAGVTWTPCNYGGRRPGSSALVEVAALPSCMVAATLVAGLAVD